MKDVKIKKIFNGSVPRVFLKVTYKDDYENDVVKELELFGDHAEKFLAKDIEYIRKQIKATEGDLDFVSRELEDAARDFVSDISSGDFVRLLGIIDEMKDNMESIGGYTYTREALRAALWLLEKGEEIA